MKVLVANHHRIRNSSYVDIIPVGTFTLRLQLLKCREGKWWRTCCCLQTVSWNQFTDIIREVAIYKKWMSIFFFQLNDIALQSAWESSTRQRAPFLTPLRSLAGLYPYIFFLHPRPSVLCMCASSLLSSHSKQTRQMVDLQQSGSPLPCHQRPCAWQKDGRVHWCC